MAEYIDCSLEKENGNCRSSLYKKPISRHNLKLEVDYDDSPQEMRRQEFLTQQKKHRESAYNNTRGILGENYNSEEEDEMEVDVDKGKKNYTKYRRSYYENRLMLSEWMLEVPQDFTEKWIMLPCPEGQRTLLVARKGKTRAYTRRGKKVSVFNSALPAGCSEDYKKTCTLLDCIWDPREKIYYVLDVLAWSNQPFVDCDTEFRFFWLQNHLEQNTEFQERGSLKNSFPILPLPRVFCDSDLSWFLDTLPPLALDGFLFFHREAHYTHGRTPLVTWLKPYMLTEILGIAVPSSMNEKPNGYIDLRHYVSRNKTKKKITDDLMETVPQESQ